ncbi:competence protein ComGA [Lactobacillus colini]|uniref:Competence protein ComGA n=1 Tax=Lactobacillus colini TaxID=1819254 RepID=A0ABS4MET0_9LACO|nr:competence type IV pilus ATPase ComGA [Lactobacillus colini]MBP2057872.1 competence protein ComGA [Lactobacillus colini]
MDIQAIANDILIDAINKRVSDIFIMPAIDKYLVKFRLKENVQEFKKVDYALGRELLNYYKFISQMDIAEHRRPQVGSLIKEVAKKRYFLRLSCIGNFNDQESLVIRVIYGMQENRYFLPEQLEQLELLAKRRGMIVTSGPTGSGKTSTMYQVAHSISCNKMVMTIEDPVEIWEETFLQTQVNNVAAITYSDLLKAALRHRPDILIIGEIRDSQTAKLAVNAALSGHLVLATVHAKSTFQTLSRLEGLGVRQDELANSLTAISYQRLLLNQDRQLSCILDIASGKQLRDEIFNSERGNFISWKNNLTYLKKQGQIDEVTFNDYQEG